MKNEDLYSAITGINIKVPLRKMRGLTWAATKEFPLRDHDQGFFSLEKESGPLKNKIGSCTKRKKNKREVIEKVGFSIDRGVQGAAGRLKGKSRCNRTLKE